MHIFLGYLASNYFNLLYFLCIWIEFTKLIVIRKCWYYSFPFEASATLMALLWLTQARASPDGEKQTLCTQPPHSLYSRSNSPKGILDPHGVGPGLSSMSLIYAEKILWQQQKNPMLPKKKWFKKEILCSIISQNIQTCSWGQQSQLPAACCWDASLDSKRWS